jgi:hypothetical protein
MNSQKITVEASRPFRWCRGWRLEALSDVTLVFPGSLVQPDEQIGAIIEVSSDSAKIGFRYADGSPGKIESIICQIASGTSVRLMKNSEAIALHHTNDPVTFLRTE